MVRNPLHIMNEWLENSDNIQNAELNKARYLRKGDVEAVKEYEDKLIQYKTKEIELKAEMDMMNNDNNDYQN
jgi:hypothetical protein